MCGCDSGCLNDWGPATYNDTYTKTYNYQTTYLPNSIWVPIEDHVAPTKTAPKIVLSTLFSGTTGTLGIPSLTIPAQYTKDGNLGYWYEEGAACTCNQQCSCHSVATTCSCLSVLSCHECVCLQVECSCVPAGSMVSTPTGSMPVENLRVGDQVSAYDEYTWEPLTTTVNKLTVHPHTLIYEISTPHGSVIGSLDHRVFVNGAWEPFKKVKAGDLMRWLVNGVLIEAPVDSVRCSNEYATVYHMHLADGHVFIADGLPAHNKGGGICCVGLDSLISTPCGDIEIKDVNLDDVIITHCFDTDEDVTSRVIAKTRSKRLSTFEVVTDKTSLKITGDHPMYCQNKGWSILDDLEDFNVYRAKYDLDLKNLAPKDQILSVGGGSSEVVDTKEFLALNEMQTLGVAHKDHNFYANSLLVHNSGGGSCVSPETLVDTPKGLVQIKDLDLGDLICTFNPETLENTPSEVISITTIYRDHHYDVEFSDGSVVEISEEHPFYSRARGWVSCVSNNKYYTKLFGVTVNQLEVGDVVVGREGDRTVATITEVVKEELMINIAPAEGTTFNAGGLIVHVGYGRQ